jgi:addiction module HigA family antidote
MPPSQPHPGGAAVLVNLRPTLIGCSTFFFSNRTPIPSAESSLKEIPAPSRAWIGPKGAGAERSFGYAPLEIVRKTLSQHEIATVQTTWIDEAAGIGARHRSRQMNRMKPRHVVRLTYLNEEFLRPLGMSVNALAIALRVPATRIGAIVKGERAVTADTALRLARFYGTSPEFWMNLQAMHDLTKARMQSGEAIARDVRPCAA